MDFFECMCRFQVNDTIRVDISTNKIMDFIKFEAGNICMVTGGANTGRVGIIMNRERHQGSFDIVHVKVKKKCFHSLPIKKWIENWSMIYIKS